MAPSSGNCTILRDKRYNGINRFTAEEIIRNPPSVTEQSSVSTSQNRNVFSVCEYIFERSCNKYKTGSTCLTNLFMNTHVVIEYISIL